MGWAKTKYSVSFYVKKTIYVDGKNKDLVIKRLGSEKCDRGEIEDCEAEWLEPLADLLTKIGSDGE